MNPTGIGLRMERSIQASVDTVYRALTSKDAVGRWFGPSDDFDVTVHEWDCREGGGYRVEMKTPDGESHVAIGRFTEIVPNRKVSYTWTWEGQPPMDTLVTFQVEADGEGTALTFTHDGFPAEEVRGHHEQGWTGSLARLEREATGR